MTLLGGTQLLLQMLHLQFELPEKNQHISAARPLSRHLREHSPYKSASPTAPPASDSPSPPSAYPPTLPSHHRATLAGPPVALRSRLYGTGLAWRSTGVRVGSYPMTCNCRANSFFFFRSSPFSRLRACNASCVAARELVDAVYSTTQDWESAKEFPVLLLPEIPWRVDVPKSDLIVTRVSQSPHPPPPNPHHGQNSSHPTSTVPNRRPRAPEARAIPEQEGPR